MRISKKKVSQDSIELRIKTKGRKPREWRRRFDTNKLAEAFIVRLNRLLAFDETYGPRFLDGTPYDDLIEEYNNPHAKKDGLLRKFSEEWDYWMRHKYPKFSPGWKANIDGYVVEFKELRDKKISDITPTLMDELDFLLDDEGNSRKTINLKLGWIRSILEFAVKRRRIVYNPVAGYTFTKPPEPVIEFWEREEALSFLSFANNKYPRGTPNRGRFIAYLVALNAVPRAGELWGLIASNLKKDRGVISIERQFDVKSKEFREMKGKQARTAPLNEMLIKETSLYIEQLGLVPGDLLFKSAAGGPVDHDAFRLIFEEDQLEWGGRRIKFHALRHTGATLMLASGVNIKTLQEILGHKDIKTTMRYAHALAEAVKNAGSIFSLGVGKVLPFNPPPPPLTPLDPVAEGRKIKHLQLVV